MNPDPDLATLLFPTLKFPLLSPNWGRISPWVTQDRHKDLSGPQFYTYGKWGPPYQLCRTHACSWRTQSRGLSIKQKDAHSKVVRRGPRAGHPTPVPTIEASKALPVSGDFNPGQPRLSGKHSPHPVSETSKFQGFSRSTRSAPTPGCGGGAAEVRSVRSSCPPHPPATVSGHPRPRVSRGRGEFPAWAGPAPSPRQSPHAKEAALCHLCLAPATALVARATLEVIFDPKGAPY